jgi:hypothetical protein
MDIVNFDALKAQDRIIDPSQVDPEEDYFIIGKYTNHYTTNSMKYTKYPVFAIKAGDVMGTLPAYKVYSALVSQTGTDDPTAIVLQNTLGVPVTWYRENSSGPGNYYAEAFGAFTLGKTVIVPGVINFTALNNTTLATLDQVFILTIGTGLSPIPGPDDALLNNTFIEIRVYN